MAAKTVGVGERRSRTAGTVGLMTAIGSIAGGQGLYSVATAVVHHGASGLSRSDLISIAGLLVTAVGLTFTIAQVRKTLSAAQATQASVKDTLGKLARDEMLGLIADLQRADRDLQSAIDAGQPGTLVGDRLADWRDKGYGLWELVHRDPKIPRDVRDDLLESAKVAAELRVNLPGQIADMPAATKSIRASVSRVCGQLATLEQQLRFDTGDQ